MTCSNINIGFNSRIGMKYNTRSKIKQELMEEELKIIEVKK
jgi:hypothetical protein